MSIGSFFFENNIVIKNNKIKNELREKYISKNRNKGGDKSIYENVYFQKNQDYLIAIEKYNETNQTIVNLNFIELINLYTYFKRFYSPQLPIIILLFTTYMQAIN